MNRENFAINGIIICIIISGLIFMNMAQMHRLNKAAIKNELKGAFAVYEYEKDSNTFWSSIISFCTGGSIGVGLSTMAVLGFGTGTGGAVILTGLAAIGGSLIGGLSVVACIPVVVGIIGYIYYSYQNKEYSKFYGIIEEVLDKPRPVLMKWKDFFELNINLLYLTIWGV